MLVVLSACTGSGAGAPAPDASTGSGGQAGAGPSDAGSGGADAAATGGQCDASADSVDSIGVDPAVQSACQACELGADPSVVPSCDPAFLSAQKDSSGAPVGWGINTLSSAAERAAALALLRCVNASGCAANAGNTGPGDNAALGCFCGAGVAAVDCIGGQGVHGACVAEYEAAAIASPGGPPACASLPAFAAFVTMATAGAAGPIALVGNIKRCAVNAGCSVCDQL